MALQVLSTETPIVVKDSELDGIDGGDPETVYTLKQITPEQARAISKKHTINRKTGPSTDALAVLDDLLDLALIAWSGVEADGRPVDCRREYKLLLDMPRKQALVTMAATNRVARAEVRDASFRESPGVV